MRSSELVLCDGPAGSGKTYLAVAIALEALRSEQVRKIVLVRPAVEAGEKLGFLPGDMFAKVNPFLRPLLDAIHDMLDQEQVRRYMANDVIEIVPLAFMRGRTLNDTFMILDEAQNTTCTQMKMFLTRMGLNSRIVVTGDSTQIDLEKDVESGLWDGICATFSYTWGCDCSPEWTGYCPPSTGSGDCFGVRNSGCSGFDKVLNLVILRITFGASDANPSALTSPCRSLVLDELGSHRLASFGLHRRSGIDLIAAFRDYRVLSQVLIALLTVLLLLCALQAWKPRFHYRAGQFADVGVQSRIDFEVENVAETLRIRRDAEAAAPLVLIQEATVIDRLVSQLRAQLSEVSNANSVDQLSQPTLDAFGFSALERERARTRLQSASQSTAGC